MATHKLGERFPHAAALLGKDAAKLTLRDIKKMVTYDPETGSFYYGVLGKSSKYGWQKQYAGRKMATSSKNGDYCRTNFCGYSVKSHRLAWLLMTGKWPKGMVDHINGDRSDNRWENLRDANYSQNAINRRKLNSNNTSGARQVSWNKEAKKWRAYVRANGRITHVGYFDLFSDAVEAQARKEVEIWGEYSPHYKKD